MYTLSRSPISQLAMNRSWRYVLVSALLIVLLRPCLVAGAEFTLKYSNAQEATLVYLGVKRRLAAAVFVGFIRDDGTESDTALSGGMDTVI